MQETMTVHQILREVQESVREYGPAKQAQLWDETAERADLRKKFHAEQGDETSAAGLSSLAENARLKASLCRSRALKRPTRGLGGLFARGLPPLPDVHRPTREEFKSLRGYWFLPVLTFVGVITTIVTMAGILPSVFMTSPVSAATEAAGGDSTTVLSWISTAIFAALCVVVIVKGPRKFYDMFYDLALEEEIQFRMGAENFTTGQKIRSSLQFGFAHFFNLIVAAFTLGALALVGAIFMQVYLREFKRSGDPRRATAAAAKFHTNYNMAVIGFGVLLCALNMMFLLT